MITRISSVIRPKGSDLIFDHPYNADYARLAIALKDTWDCAQIVQFGAGSLGSPGGGRMAGAQMGS